MKLGAGRPGVAPWAWRAWPSSQLLLTAVAVHAAAWTLAPALCHLSVPLDVAEGYGWGREWPLATYKHPAFPAWVLEASRMLTGAVGWPAYVISQAFVAATFGFAYLLGREFMTQDKASVGVLLLSGIAFYAWPTVEFNHNIAQMPFWTAIPYLLWRAVQTQRLTWWVFVGLAAGSSFYAKFSSGLLLAVLAIWMLHDPAARLSFRTFGVWLAAGIAVVMVAPLALWLFAHEFAPVAYAASRAAREGNSLLTFLGGLALNVGGLFLLMGLVGLRPSLSSEPRAEDVGGRAIQFLIYLAAGPVALAVIAALLARSGLRSAWGSAMFSFVGLLAVSTVPVSRLHVRKLFQISLILSAALSTGYAAIVAWNPTNRGNPMRVNWPQAEISQRFVELWNRDVGKPLRIVGGGNWVADLVALTAPGSPSIYTGRVPSDSPWITPDRIEREGVLFVWHAGRSQRPRLLERFTGLVTEKEERFTVRRWGHDAEVVIRYAILPPAR